MGRGGSPFGPGREQQHPALLRHGARERRQPFQRRGIRPVQVLDEQQHRSGTRLRLQPALRGFHQQRLLQRGGDVHHLVPADLQRQPDAEDRQHALHVAAGRGQQGRQALDDGVVGGFRIAALRAHQGQHGREGAVFLLGPAGGAQHQPLAPLHLRQEGFAQAGFADAGLAAHQHRAAPPCDRVPPAAAQRQQLAPPAHGLAQRLPRCLFGQHAEGRYFRGGARQAHAALRHEAGMVAQALARRLAHDHLAVGRRGFHPHRDVQRAARHDRTALDQDGARVQADADLPAHLRARILCRTHQLAGDPGGQAGIGFGVGGVAERDQEMRAQGTAQRAAALHGDVDEAAQHAALGHLLPLRDLLVRRLGRLREIDAAVQQRELPLLFVRRAEGHGGRDGARAGARARPQDAYQVVQAHGGRALPELARRGGPVLAALAQGAAQHLGQRMALDRLGQAEFLGRQLPLVDLGGGFARDHLAGEALQEDQAPGIEVGLGVTASPRNCSGEL